MVEEGAITAEQGAELMAAMNADVPAQEIVMRNGVYDKKLFRVIVDSPVGDKVNVQFPVGAVKKLLKATGKLPLPLLSACQLPKRLYFFTMLLYCALYPFDQFYHRNDGRCQQQRCTVFRKGNMLKLEHVPQHWYIDN